MLLDLLFDVSRAGARDRPQRPAARESVARIQFERRQQVCCQVRDLWMVENDGCGKLQPRANLSLQPIAKLDDQQRVDLVVDDRRQPGSGAWSRPVKTFNSSCRNPHRNRSRLAGCVASNRSISGPLASEPTGAGRESPEGVDVFVDVPTACGVGSRIR